MNQGLCTLHSANMLRIAIETVEAFARGERLHVAN
jgi:hypothetical protein